MRCLRRALIVCRDRGSQRNGDTSSASLCSAPSPQGEGFWNPYSSLAFSSRGRLWKRRGSPAFPFRGRWREAPEEVLVHSLLCVRWFERPEKCPVDILNALLDALWALQRERVGRPPFDWRAAIEVSFLLYDPTHAVRWSCANHCVCSGQNVQILRCAQDDNNGMPVILSEAKDLFGWQRKTPEGRSGRYAHAIHRAWVPYSPCGALLRGLPARSR